MKEKRDCKIVQDLLPNYVDKLTSKETNAYIEEHIKDCKDCTKILEAMKKDISLEDKKREKKKVKYIKKYNHKLRVLKISLLSIILIIALVFIAFPGRNMMRIASLREKFDVYAQKSDNVYIKNTVYPSQTTAIYEKYCKDGVEKYIMTFPEENLKEINYIYPNQSKVFTDGPDGKTLEIENRENVYIFPLPNYIYADTFKDTFIISMLYDITTGELNGKECYIFNRKYDEQERKLEFYIEKDTGLMLQSTETAYSDSSETVTVQYEYSFGTVTDEDMQEPDATEYGILEE